MCVQPSTLKVYRIEIIVPTVLNRILKKHPIALSSVPITLYIPKTSPTMDIFIWTISIVESNTT